MSTATLSQPPNTAPFHEIADSGDGLRIHRDIISTTGRTPLIRLNRLTRGIDAIVAVKGEFFNPLGSVKDRIGAGMVEAAEAS